jgi:hypothetical protein
LAFSPFQADKSVHKLYVNLVRHLGTFENKKDNNITDKKCVCCDLDLKYHSMTHELEAASWLHAVSDWESDYIRRALT